MNNKRIAEIRERCEAATPGPWNWVCDDPEFLTLGTTGMELEYHVLSAWKCKACQESGLDCLWPRKDNAAFIANSREDIDYLVNEVDRLTALLVEVERERDSAREEICRRCEEDYVYHEKPMFCDDCKWRRLEGREAAAPEERRKEGAENERDRAGA